MNMLLILTVSVSCHMPAMATTPDASLDKPVADFSAFKGDEFSYLCGMQHRPCGLEQMRCGDVQVSTYAPTRVNYRKMTFRKALDKVARLHPGYRWVIRNGVINFEPAHRTITDLLSRRIDKVSIHGISSEKAAYLVLRLARIRAPGIAGSGPVRIFPTIDLNLSGVTLRDALNAIAKADGLLHWNFAPDVAGESRVCFAVSR